MSTQVSPGFALVAVLILLAMVGLSFLLISEQTATASSHATTMREDTQLTLTQAAAMTYAQWELDRKGCSGYDNGSGQLGSDSYQALFSSTGGSPVDIELVGTLASGRERRLNKLAYPSHDVPVTVTVDVTDMTELDKNKPNDNYGADDKAHVRDDADKQENTLLRFALDQVPDGARIDQALLNLPIQKVAVSDAPFGIARVTLDWDENQTTWQMAVGLIPWVPAGGSTNGRTYATFSANPGTPTGTPTAVADITQMVREWQLGAPNYGAIILPNGSGEHIHLWTDDSMNVPSVTIDYRCECGQPCVAS